MGKSTIVVWGGEGTSYRLGHSTQRANVPGVPFGRRAGHICSSPSNPTVASFGGKVAALEGAEAATIR